MGRINMYPANPESYTSSFDEFGIGNFIDAGDGVKWVWVKISASSANAASTGRLFYHTATPFVVSDDYSGHVAYGIAGLAQGTVAKSTATAPSFCFIKSEDPSVTILKAASTAIAIGDYLMPSSTDGKVGKRTGGQAMTTTYFGTALAVATSTATTVTASFKAMF